MEDSTNRELKVTDLYQILIWNQEMKILAYHIFIIKNQACYHLACRVASLKSSDSQTPSKAGSQDTEGLVLILCDPGQMIPFPCD